MRPWVKIFRSRPAGWMISALVVQQIIVASSNYWLVLASTALGKGEKATHFVLAYLLSLVLPYIPGAFAVVWSRQWQLVAWDRLISQTSQTWFHKPFLWQDKTEGERRTAALCKEAPTFTQDVCTMTYQGIASLLNLILNVAVIAWTVDGSLLLTFLLGAVLALGWMYAQRKRTSRFSVEAEETKLQVTAIIQKMWDNVVLGNHVNHRHWRATYSTRFSQLKSAVMRHVTFLESSAVGMTTLCFIPTLGAATWLMFGGGSVAPLAVLVVLPRLFQLMVTCDGLFQLAQEALSIRARGAFLIPLFFEAADQRQHEARIHWEKIATNQCPQTTLRLRENILNSQLPPGRYTVTGANGVGKTSLMLWIKACMGEPSLYLPASHHLLFAGKAFQGSTGQMTRLSVEAAMRESDIGMLILDEWDANLDESARALVSQTLDRLAERLPIVEVCHRISTEAYCEAPSQHGV